MDVGVLVGTGVGVVAGAVGGTVVDDENVGLRSVLADPVQCRGQGLDLVVGGDDDECLHFSPQGGGGASVVLHLPHG